MSKYVASFEYTDAELLALYRQCLARISVAGQEYQMTMPGGGTRSYTAADLPEVSDMVDRLQTRVNAASYSPIATLYARMKRA